MQMIPLTEPDIRIIKCLLRQQSRKYGALFGVMLLLFVAAWLWLRHDLGLAANAVGLVLVGVMVFAAACTFYLQFGPLLKDRKARLKYISAGTIADCYLPAGTQQKDAGFFIALQTPDKSKVVKWLQLSQRYYEQLQPGDEVTFTWLPCSRHILKASFSDNYVTALKTAEAAV